ncbi:MAG: acylneuraminate cytidylyltransferase family protein [Pseudomonadota bacterium]
MAFVPENFEIMESPAVLKTSTDLRLLGLVLARGGSKRIPNKNIRPLNGRPLLSWTIQAALASGILETLLLSTDDPQIAAIGRADGASVPWLRPAHLSTDTASSVDAALHALDWYEATHGAIDGLVLLQPTTPFRSAETIRSAVLQFARNKARSLVSLAPAKVHPAWCFRVSHDNNVTPFLGWDAIGTRSQDLEPAYVVNGALYITPPGRLRRDRTFIADDTAAFVMTDAMESLDIDVEEDWDVAEAARR